MKKLGKSLENDILTENQNEDILKAIDTLVQDIAELITNHPDKKVLCELLNEAFYKINTINNLSNLCVEYLLNELSDISFLDKDDIINALKVGVNEINGIDFDLLELDNLNNHRILRQIKDLSQIVESEFEDFGEDLPDSYEIPNTLNAKIEEIINYCKDLYFDEFETTMHVQLPRLQPEITNSLGDFYLFRIAENIKTTCDSDTNSPQNKIKNAMIHAIYQSFLQWKNHLKDRE